jgi:hypothetical protein
MEQDAPNLMGFQALGRSASPQIVWGRLLKLFLFPGHSLRCFWRQQSKVGQETSFHESLAEELLPSRSPRDLATHATSDPALFVFGLLAALLVAIHALWENAHSCGQQLTLLFIDESPADGVRTEVKAERAGRHGEHRKIFVGRGLTIRVRWIQSSVV